jgi:plasmid stability protein
MFPELATVAGVAGGTSETNCIDSMWWPCCYHRHVKQLITRVDEALAEAVKERAALTGESVNAYVTRLLRAAIGGRQAWKSEAIAAGRLIPRASHPSPHPRATVSTAPGYASALVSSERDER